MNDQTNTKTYEFVGFDIETYNDSKGRKVFICGSLVYQEEGEEKIEYYTDKEAYIKRMLSTRFENHYLVATKLRFEFNVLFWKTPHWDKFHSIIRQHGRIIYAELRNSRGKKIRFTDTLNYAPMSVEKLAPLVELFKLKKPSWLGKRPPKDYDEAQYLKSYNIMDSRISAAYMRLHQTVTNNLQGTIQMTGAGTALNIYRKSFLKEPLIKEEYILKEDIKPFIYEAYYGGRTEAFSRGKIEGAHYYDVNSIYPGVMREEYPLPQSVCKPRNATLTNIKEYEGVSRVTIKQPHTNYPVLPHKMQYKGGMKLIFPTGTWTGTYNHNELRYAQSKGVIIKKIHEQIIYTKKFKPFKDWVERLYSLRRMYQEQDNPMQAVIKLTMNSLYGKFAQKEINDTKILQENNVTIEDVNGADTFEWYEDIVVLNKKRETNSVFTFPILSSYTSSKARIQMHQIITETEALYTDTDSVITLKEMPTTTEIGGLKLEQIITEGIIVRPKLYRIENTIKAKGYHKPDREGFEALLRGEKIDCTRMAGTKEALKRGYEPEQELEIWKEASTEDNKRQWERPFSTEELQHSTPLCIHEL